MGIDSEEEEEEEECVEVIEECRDDFFIFA
jgi:hypothetical protein